MMRNMGRGAVLAGLLGVGCVLGLAIAVSSPASAASQKVRSACKDDYLKFCPSYEPHSTKARQCMRQTGKRLSRKCIDALVDAGEIRRPKR